MTTSTGFAIESGDWNDPEKLEAYRAHTAKGGQGKETMNMAALEKKRLYDMVAQGKALTEEQQAQHDELKAADAARQVQVDKILHCFTTYDADDSKTLDVRELGKVLVECGMKRTEADALFKAIDRDGNKAITPKEFINWVFACDGSEKVAQRALRAIKPEEAINEFLQFLNKLRSDPDFADKCEAVFKTRKLTLTNDAGGDLAIDDLFKYMDTNANGTISFAEFKSALSSMGFAMDTKLSQGVFRLMDTAKKHPKKIIDFNGEIVELRDGVLDWDDFEKAMTGA